MTKILVTGGAGFIGSHLAPKLAAIHGVTVAVMDNLHSPAPRANHLLNSVEFHQADIRDSISLDKAMRGSDIVYHLAAQSNVMGSVHQPDYSFSTNVVGTYKVLRSAGQAGVRRLVFASSREVYGDARVLPVGEDTPLMPISPYGASKAAGEAYCRVQESIPEVIVLRLANVYGPGDRGRVIPLFIRAALRNEPLIVFGGGQLLDFVPVDTVADVLVRIGMGSFVPGPLNIGSGEGVIIHDLAGHIVAAAGSNSRVTTAPSRPYDVRGFVADIRRAREAIGLRETSQPLSLLRECVEWERRQLEPIGVKSAAHIASRS